MKYLLLGIGIVALFNILLVSPALAQEEASLPEASLPDPGLTPDHPLYFLDDFWKSIRLSFTRKVEARVELRLKFAQEKLAEMQAMAEEKKEEALAKATARYEEHLAEINERLERANLTDERRAQIEERLATAAERHQTALDRIEDRTEKRFRHLIDQARDKSHEQRINALEMLREHQPERAAELTAEAIERRVDHLEELLERDDLTAEQRAELEARLANLEELRVLGEEIEDEVDDEEIRGLLNRRGQQAVRTLERVLEQVPEEARQAIQGALERIRLHAATTTGTTTDSRRRPEERREQRRTEFCIQVITPARNPETGETRDFPTPCDVPEGWETLSPRVREELRERFEDFRTRTRERIEERHEGRIETPGFFLFNLFPFLED